MKEKQVRDLVPGDVIVELDPPVTVLTVPKMGQDGRAHFQGQDSKFGVVEHAMQPDWTVGVKR